MGYLTESNIRSGLAKGFFFSSLSTLASVSILAAQDLLPKVVGERENIDGIVGAVFQGAHMHQFMALLLKK